jgi:PKD repeat protein/type 1 glutamine amidotransferase
MRRNTWLACCLCTLLSLTLVSSASAQDWSSLASPLGGAEAVQVQEPAHVLIFTETTAFRHTEAIEQGTPLIRAALEQAGITSEHTEDSTIFNDTDLARFDALVMFQASGDPWTAAEKAAMERYQHAGGGIVAIHNAADMRGNYQWWDNLIGSLMPGHAATGTSPGQPGQVIVEDRTHPSTAHLQGRWSRADEWYNFSTNVRGDAHVLATMDETTYAPGSNAMGYDHPISWCKPYEGGRAWVTAMGHFGAHYSEPAFMQHIVGGVAWAAGAAPGDCGGTRNDSFEKVALDENTSTPFALDVAPDGRVFYTELVGGQIRVYNPETKTVKTAITLDVYWGGEDGLLGIAVAPDFETTGHIYVYYAPDSADNSDPANFKSRVSRFTVDASSNIDPASEKLIIEVPARREPDEPGHTGGMLDFDLEGNLLLSVGDDVNPHSEPSGGYAPLSERDGTFHDARATSANTNDLRGKLLRITPGPDGGYTIPEGNLFPEAQDTQDKTQPEIYAMGFRNPFRFSVDPNTGWIGLADYAPDSGTDRPADRGPAGIVEWNLIKSPGNYGWPLCIGDNEPYRDVDYRTSPVTVGDFFDCANPVNDSVRNTGLTNLPPARPPVMYYGYTTSSVPAVIPAGNGLAPMGGPFYDFDPNLESDVKFPEYFDGKPFFYEWSKNRIYSTILDDEGTKLEKISRFLPTESFLAPQDLKFGPDGALYVLEWGGGFGRDNPDSGIYRIDFISGSRSPVAVASATPDNGQEPLTVAFSGLGSSDPEGGTLTYAWDFDGNGTIDSTEPTPTHTYAQPGVYQARLTVTDPAGKEGTKVIPITVGNTKPTVEFAGPVDGGFFDWGDAIGWSVNVSDPEDGTIDPQDVTVTPSLGHDDHDHATTGHPGTTGSLVTDLGSGHAEDMNVFYTLSARYTDRGDGEIPPLTSTDVVVLQPKHKEAEHADRTLGTGTAAATGDLEGGVDALTGLAEGDWAAYEPVNFTGTDTISFRVASTQAGGAIELRSGAPDGELLGTADVPATGGMQTWSDVTVPAPDSTETMSLYLVFKGTANFRLNFWEIGGKGLSPDSRPSVRITSPTPMQALQPGPNTLVAEASDAENEIAKVEFFVDGAKVGEDTSAPYSVDWTQTEEDYYVVHAVATNSKGLTSDSRRVRFTIGEFGVRPPWQTFSSVPDTQPASTFDQLGDNFTVSAAGNDVWQATNHYGTVYLPGGAPENFVATVKVASFDGTHSNSKAGIMVRNDITAANTSPGYLVVGQMGDGRTEFMHDAGGNGQVNSSGEPVAYGCPGDDTPTWLKVEKYGKDFIVSCSKNGTDWTQVGAKTTIPSAAAVQDIGLFVVSHISGTKATAQFSDWAIDTDPVIPDPEPEYDAPPACAAGLSDEFDGPLSTSRWTVRRGTVATSNGNLVLPVTNGDINEGNTGAISYAGQPVPSGDWQVETKIDIAHDNEWQHAALAQIVDDDNYVKFAATMNSGGTRFLEFQTETSGSRSWHGANVNLPATAPSTIHLRLARTGDTLAASYSPDGTTWTPMNGTATLKPGGTIGVLAAGDTDAQNVNAMVDYFRVTPDAVPQDPGPDDAFDGTGLDGCRWDRIHHYKTSRLGVAGGKLSIETFNADIDGANNGPIENLILQTPPEGDWTVETKMTAPVADNWQLAGLLLYSDDDHYVKYDVVADNAPGAPPARRVELRYENGGPLTGPGGTDPAPPASATDTWWLRLTKTGDTYTGAISADGETWVQSPGSVTVALDDPAIGLMATGPDQAAPITVDFDHFRVVPDDVDPHAPTVQAFADPASGEAPLRVRFSATGLDPDGGPVDYDWEFEDGTAVTRNVTRTFDEPGEHTATVTVTDEEGKTASDTVTVTVTPRVNDAPTVEAGADVTSGDAPLRVRFSATGDDPDGRERDLEYAWDFGDGQAAFGRNAVHRYAAPGTYDAEVTVTDPDGASATDTVAITVTNSAPVVRVGAAPASGTAPLAVRFTSEATDTEAGALTYRWDFGDGGSAATRNANHTYGAPGTYTAKVTVTDKHGAAGSAQVVITVANPPGNVAPTVQAAADPASGSAPLRVRFTSAARDADGDPLTSVWDFGDGGRAGGTSAVHTYTQAGTYDAKVTVTDPGGRTGTATVRVTVSGAGAVAGEQTAQARVKLARTQSANRVVKRGLRYRVACEATCRVSAVLRLAGGERRRLGAATARTVRAGASRTVVVWLDRRVRRNLIAAMRASGVRRLRATLVTIVRDADGRRTLRERVVLRR